MTRKARTGKLPAETLARLLERYAAKEGQGVLAGPKVGLDAAAVAVRAGTLVLASDPVTYAVADIGRYAVHVNANDLYVCGARPLWFLADVLLPEGAGRLAERIFAQLRAACDEIGAALVGGHTEMTPGLPRPMVAGFMIGRAEGGRVVTADAVRPGDAIILTKGVAIEGTACIAAECGRRLAGRLPRGLLRRAKGFLTDPGIGVGPEAAVALRCGARAMHDPTEGGLANGLLEMAQASGLTLEIDEARVPVYPETAAVCEHFCLDPLRLLASGALLIACPARRAGGLVAALEAESIPAARIGAAREGPPELRFASRRPMTRSAPDEILKTFQ